MAGDDEGDGIRRAGARDGACCARLAEGRCHLAIGPCLATGDPLQRLPDATLEGGREHVERNRTAAVGPMSGS